MENFAEVCFSDVSQDFQKKAVTKIYIYIMTEKDGNCHALTFMDISLILKCNA